MNYKCLTLLFSLLICQQIFSQAPVISSFSPTSGPIGSSVIITGSNFHPNPDSNIVFFGAVKAKVNGANVTTLNVTVPAGATYQPITVLVKGLTAYSANPFLVTFANGELNFTATSFDNVVNYSSGFSTSCVAAGDLDLDGKVDLITAAAQGGGVSMFRNISDSNIALASQIYVGSGSNIFCLAVSDLDGDGRLDIVAANGNQNNVLLFRNLSIGPGQMAFASRVDLPTGTFPYAVAIKDFNGDGKPDIAAVNSTGNTVSILKNNSSPGSFAFSTKVDFATGSSPFWIDAGDLDGDGKPDIATANGSATNSVSILRNTSTASTISFAAKVDFDGGNLGYGISLADFNNDTKQDLVIANGAGAAASVLLNTSTGPGNISFSAKQLLSTGYFAYGAAAGDMNGDGKLDAVVANQNQYSVSVFKNNSSGNSLEFDASSTYQVHYNPWAVLPVDLDNDGKADIVSADNGFGYISVLKNRAGAPKINSFTPDSGGNGALITINGVNLNWVTNIFFGGIAAKSFNVISSTKIEVLVDSGMSGRVKVAGPYGSDSLFGFRFTSQPTITSFSPAFGTQGSVVNIYGTNLSNINSVKFGNLPAASFSIISPTLVTAVVGTLDSTLMSISLSNANDTCSAPGFYAGPIITSFSPKSGSIGSVVTITGLNFKNTISGNKVFFAGMQASVIEASANVLKVIVPRYSKFGPISVVSNSLIAYSEESFVTTFTGVNSEITNNSLVLKGDSTTGNGPLGVASADFDGDGKDDIVVTNFNSLTGSLAVFKNKSQAGYISFDKKIDIPTTRVASRVVTGDIDGDGKYDIVVENNNDGSISVLRNTSENGIISFAPDVEFLTGDISGIKIKDIDMDGKADIIGWASAFVIIRNNSSSSISFEPAVKIYKPSISYGGAFDVGDIDNDHKQDILLLGGGNAMVLRNKTISGQPISLKSFEQTTAFPSLADATSVKLVDIDNDGLLDLVANNFNSFIGVQKNQSNTSAISFTGIQDYYFGDYASSSYATTISPADFNGDGIIDLIFSDRGYYSVLKSAVISGQVQQTDNFPGFGINMYGDYIVTDLDGDGKPDLSAPVLSDNKLYFFRNTVGELFSMCRDDISILNASTKGINYKWQIDRGNGFADLIDSDTLVNSTSRHLDLWHVPSYMYGYRFRCIVDGVPGEISTLTFKNYWTGANDSNWNNAANWSCGKVPDANTDVIINSGNLIINSNVTVRSLAVKPGVNITVNTGFKLVVLH